MRVQRLQSLIGLALLSATAGLQAAAPQSIASTNLCTDQLLVMLAEPEQIASLSHLAADPEYSFVAERARRYPANSGGAEELLQLDPQLVLISSHTPRLTRARLAEQGLRSEELPAARNLEDVYRNLRTMGRWLDAAARAQTIIEAMTRRIRSLTGVPVVTVTYDGTSESKNEIILPYLQAVSAR